MSTEPVVDTPQQQRRDFVRAFTDHLWTRPGVDRPSVKPQTVITITAVCAVMALAFGVIQQLIFPPVGPTAVASIDPPPLATFSAVSGWDCAVAATHGFEVRGRTSAWYTVARGAWSQDGCQGTFAAIPMSGDASKADSGPSATWWFTPGTGFTTCDIMVFVPRGERSSDAAAAPAHYVAQAGPGGPTLATFVVDQVSQQGRWVPVGRYAMGQSGLAITLVNRGKPANRDDRIGVAQVKATCTNQ